MDSIKINSSEIVQKGISTILAVMLAFIAYFLQKIDKNIENISEKTTKLEQRYAVFEANQQSDKVMNDARFKEIEKQIYRLEGLQTTFVKLKP